MPDWKQIVRQRLAGLMLDGARESEVVEELAQHMDDRYNELLAGGVAAGEARRLALDVLNASLLAAELRHRDRPLPEPRAGLFSGLFFDLRVAWRAIGARPGFSAMVVGMLALAIAGNAAIFSIFNGMFLRPLPFRNSDRLVDLNETAPKRAMNRIYVSEPDAVSWRSANRTFDSMVFFIHPEWNLAGFGPPQRVHGAAVTRDMLRVLGLKPLLGRNFSSSEEKPNGPKVALLSYDSWRRFFHGDPAVLGRTIRLSGAAYSIVGVLPKEAILPDRASIWTPLALAGDLRNGWYLAGIGRLRPGVSIEQARADLLRIHRSMIHSGYSENAITSPTVIPVRDVDVGDYRAVSHILLGAVGVVLLIACVNIAALMMVRAGARGREIAIRTAIGASRARIVRQLLTETLLLAILGGALGVALGYGVLQGMVGLMPSDDLPQWLSFPMDLRFIGFCLLITAASAVLFGVAPTLHASRADTASSLHESSTRTSLSGRQRRSLAALVACEIALAVMLLISASLLVQAFRTVLHTDPGFRPENTLTFSLELPELKYTKPAQRAAFYHQLLDSLHALPGVRAAGATSALPLDGWWGWNFAAEGAPAPGPNNPSPVILQVVTTPAYFDAIGMTVLAGRRFDEHDDVLRVGRDWWWMEPGPGLVAIVNESFARHFWPGRNAVGRRIRHDAPGSPWMTVVGVVRDEKHFGLDQQARPAVYFPYGEAPRPEMSIVLRGAAEPESLLPAVREVIRHLDPELPIYDVRSMSQRLREALWVRRAYSWLLGAFAIVALLLAAAGTYGVIAWAVSQRTHEIGIRMALGAAPGQVLGSVLRDGMWLVIGGSAAGLLCALVGARVLQTMLYGVSPRDPLIYAGVIAGVAGVGLLANFVPALRAASVDPVRALRTE